jgi:methyltransferase (TIGR00027 family)
MTARRVAAQRLGFERIPTSYGDPDADQRLQADVAAGVSVAPSRMARYLQARTTFFDRAVVAAIDAGVTQLVAVGAGYDARSLRYAKPGVRWFELDHPDTHDDKVRRVGKLGLDTAGVTFVAADFVTDDVAAALAGAGLDPDRPAALFCEGVLGYLPRRAADGLLGALHDATAPMSRFVLTMMLSVDRVAERLRRARLGVAVASMGEPLQTSWDRQRLRDELAAVGWRVQAATDVHGVDVTESSAGMAFVQAQRL